jgi:DnaJ-class molecular chaperone
MYNKKNVVRCSNCQGCGFVKTDPIKCDICKGKKCISCQDTGLTVFPWSLCTICNGDGELFDMNVNSSK